MKPNDFPEANKHLIKPEDMKEEECGTLPVFTNGLQVYSLWKMTWKERLSALLFGNVWLVVYSGQTQPPVDLLVQRELFTK